MPLFVPLRRVASLIPWWLAVVVLFLAGCAKAPPPSPSAPSIDSGAVTVPNVESVRTPETEQAGVPSPRLPGEPMEESPPAPDRLTAIFEGKVTDGTGAVIPGVEVTVTSDATGEARTIRSDETGRYSLPVLRPGSYTVQGTSDGFRSATRSGVQMGGGGNARIDLELHVGKVTGIVPVAESFRGRWGSPPAPLPPSFNTEKYGTHHEPGFAAVANKPLSTFSVDVDSASYSNVRRFLRDGKLPPASAVRIEELINYFDYDYPEPAEGEPFSIVSEMAGCPWEPSHRLVHIGLSSIPVATANLPPNNLVFLIDVSGSMAAADKLPLLKRAFSLLARELRPQDQISIVVYAGAAGMVLPPTSGAQKTSILRTVSRLDAGGSTAGGAGIRLAYKLAREHFIEEGSNRVILATDGDFNVGVSSDGELVKMIERERKAGVFLTVLGFGTGNLKDSKMEKLADHGNGNYAYIDNLLEARRVLVEQMGATLLTVAKDVKLQVEFNPAQIKAYRLVGYENRRLRDEEFNDDRRDAGDLGAGHSVTALYEVILAGSDEPLPGVDPLKYQQATVRPDAAGSNEVLTVKLRYKPPKGSKSRLLTRVLAKPANSAVATPAFRFAAAVAEFGMILRDSPYKGAADYDRAFEEVRQTLGSDEDGRRSEFLSLIRTAEKLAARSRSAGREQSEPPVSCLPTLRPGHSTALCQSWEPPERYIPGGVRRRYPVPSRISLSVRHDGLSPEQPPMLGPLGSWERRLP